MSRRWLGLAASLALVVLVNALILVGAARNRSGPAEARLVLTERECPVLRREEDDEDTGLSLYLAWKTPDKNLRADESWISRDTLRDLGFDVSVALTDPRAARFYDHALPRDAFMVLETEGFSWRRWLAAGEAALRRETAQEWELKRMEKERSMGSRLVAVAVAVAVGRDAEALRDSYPDRSRYLILPIEIDLRVDSGDKAPRFSPAVSLRDDDISVPLPLRPLLDSFRPPNIRAPEPEAPRYRVTVATGQRFEPWLENVER